MSSRHSYYYSSSSCMLQSSRLYWVSRRISNVFLRNHEIASDSDESFHLQLSEKKIENFQFPAWFCESKWSKNWINSLKLSSLEFLDEWKWNQNEFCQEWKVEIATTSNLILIFLDTFVSFHWFHFAITTTLPLIESWIARRRLHLICCAIRSLFNFFK